MRTYRIALIVSGGLLLAFGAFRLLTKLDPADLVVLALWLVVAVALHDLVIAPATVGAGVALTQLPPRVRRYVQGGIIAGALITVVALPLIARQGTEPAVKAILLRDYTANLALLLGLVIAVSAVLYLGRMLRTPSPRRPRRSKTRRQP